MAIQRKKAIIVKIKNETSTPSSSLDTVRVQGGKPTSFVEYKALRVVDLENELQALAQEFDIIKDELINYFNKLDNELYKELLLLRYVYFENWENIASMLGYSLAHTYTLHRKAKETLKNKNLIVNNSP